MAKEVNKAIILAAGKGSRLQKLLKGNPKPLLKIGNDIILKIIIKKLQKLKIEKIIVVTGYQSIKIRKKIRQKVKFIHYPNFNKTNNLHTLLHIKDELNEPLLCLFSDVIFEISILKKLINSKKKFLLAVDKKSNLMGTMRVKIKKNLIKEIGSHINLKQSNGNFIGFAKFSKSGARMLKNTIKNYKNSKFNDYYTLAINEMIKKKNRINFIDVNKYLWKEIDTIEDYILAKQVYKKILLREKIFKSGGPCR